MRNLLLRLLALPALSLVAQNPPTFRLVTPSGPGSITINITGWTVERVTLYDHGTRAVILLTNPSLGIIASYILSNDETFDYNKESCKNDVLGTVVRDVLKTATLRNKQNGSRLLSTGQTLDMGSYLLVKNEELIDQQNVFGFISHNHTCAEIHLSRTHFKAGEDHLFDATLDSFRFDPADIPTPSDYQAMTAVLPPAMAAAYHNGPSSTRVKEETSAGQSLTFALPGHPGYVHMDAPNFVITELSAKPDGSEFGIRAQDRDISGAEALGFLFLPSPAQPTATACRDWMLRSEKSDGVTNRKIVKTYETSSESGVPIALVDYEQTKAPPSSRFVRRFFAASHDLCLDVSVIASSPLMGSTPEADLTKTLTFDASLTPNFASIFRYATVVFDHHDPSAAAPLYEKALALADSAADPIHSRRRVTDQASMAYGMAGNLAKSRAINQAAILKDPDYPLYYYNLACADAESGNAVEARAHLQQAFDRRANTLPGEHLPDPTRDDSLLKLKKDKDFWSFVQALPKS